MEKPSEGQSLPEQKENESVDFLSVFKQRLREYGDTPESDLRFDAYENAEIGEAKMEVPAVVFKTVSEKDEDEWNIWVIKEPRMIYDRYQPHQDVRDDYYEYFEGKDDLLEKVQYCAWVLQDKNNDLSLLMDSGFAEQVKGRRADDLEFLEFLRRYDIKKVVGFFDESEKTENRYKGITVINEDMIATSREDLYLLNIAQEHRMTNNQFLRLKQRAHSARDAQISFNAEDMAKEIVTEKGHL